jgi:hypothetical protein
MSTDVSISGSTATIAGKAGQLSVTEETFIGPEGITITSEAEFLAFAKAIAKEAARAWPGLEITVASSAAR